MIVTPQLTNILKLKSDIVFKAFFTREENQVFLKDFLEVVLGEKLEIKKVLHDVRLEQLAKEEKYGILDLGVELKTGKFINVEIQLRNFNNIEERTTFYASKKITEQLGNGTNYEDLKQVIIIAILDYSFIDLPDYFTETVRVAANNRNYELNNITKYYYIELRKFREQNPDMSNPLNQWLAFLDMERGDLLDMAKNNNKKIKKAFENYKVLTGDEEVKRLAEIKLKSDLEEHSALASARAKGTEQGLKEGKKLGLKEGQRIGLKEGQRIGLEEGQRIGLKKGKELGIQEGEKKAKIQIVTKLLKERISFEKISIISGLSITEIKEIQKNINKG